MKKLFVYARLEKPAYESILASAKGELRRRPDGDGAAQFNEASASTVHGEIQEYKDFKDLDKEEAPEFRRRLIKLTDGRWVYAYEYVKSDFKKLPPIPTGKYKNSTSK